MLELNVAEWEDVKHFFPEEWTEDEIEDISLSAEQRQIIDSQRLLHDHLMEMGEEGA